MALLRLTIKLSKNLIKKPNLAIFSPVGSDTSSILLLDSLFLESFAVLQRAIYVSDAAGSAGASILSMALILGASDANNRRDHLTGVLIFHRGQFMQVIEGGRTDLDRLLKRLEADPRHTRMRLLVNGPVQGGRFGSLPMSQVDVTPEIGELIGDRKLDQLSLAEAEAVFAAAVTTLGLAA